jgi:hypothetical protein
MADQNIQEYVLVPRKPTEKMLKAGWEDAHGEDAAGVWQSMIEEWESSLQQGKLD